MPVDHFCLSCSKTFVSVSALRNHTRAKRHTPNDFVCEDCDLSFLSAAALNSHMNSPRHADDDASDQFMDEYNENDVESETSDEGEDPFCDDCERQFVSMMALNQHLAYSPKHNWCFECSRDFGSDSSLRQHQNSLAHIGRYFKCPFCKGLFKSPSGIALHIESGCHQVTRHHVTAAVRKIDIIPNISAKRLMGPVQAPTSLQTYIATEASYNGSSYDCSLCGSTFRTLFALNKHLNSPAHDDDEFRCPKCKTDFKLISGFVQHLESQACSLANRKEINRYYNNLADSITPHLLKM